MSEMEQTRLEVKAGGGRSPSPSVRRTVTYKASELSLASKAGDITIQHISEAKGYLNEFEQMYRKHRAEIDALKRDHASEVSAVCCAKIALYVFINTDSQLGWRRVQLLLCAKQNRPERLESTNKFWLQLKSSE